MLAWKVIPDLLISALVQICICVAFLAWRSRHPKPCPTCEKWSDLYSEETHRRNAEWYALLLTATELTGKEQHEIVALAVNQIRRNGQHNYH